VLARAASGHKAVARRGRWRPLPGPWRRHGHGDTGKARVRDLGKRVTGQTEVQKDDGPIQCNAFVALWSNSAMARAAQGTGEHPCGAGSGLHLGWVPWAMDWV
jgi:hypothetical protein